MLGARGAVVLEAFGTVVSAELAGSGFVVSQLPLSGSAVSPGMTCRLRLSETFSP